MSYLSEKQIVYRDNLLLKLGFRNSNLFEEYKDALTEQISKLRQTTSFIVKDKDTGEEKYIPVDYNVIHYLNSEFDFKKEKKWIKKDLNKNNGLTSATDLANFTFCPIGYSISKTFETDSNKEMEIGTDFHSNLCLLKYKDVDSIEDLRNKEGFLNNENTSFFKEIFTSRLVFGGHRVNEKKYFINKVENFVGQPDYVFERKDGVNFIVEEKFKYNKEIFGFFSNHQIQLAAYLYGIEEFKTQYGYLVYWFYDFGPNGPFIKNCKTYRLNRNDKTSINLKGASEQIQKLKNGESIPFEPTEINIRK